MARLAMSDDHCAFSFAGAIKSGALRRGMKVSLVPPAKPGQHALGVSYVAERHQRCFGLVALWSFVLCKGLQAAKASSTFAHVNVVALRC